MANDQDLKGIELAKAIREGVRAAIQRALVTIQAVQKSEADALSKGERVPKAVKDDVMSYPAAPGPRIPRDTKDKMNTLFGKEPKVLHPSDKKVKKAEIPSLSTPPAPGPKTAKFAAGMATPLKKMTLPGMTKANTGDATAAAHTATAATHTHAGTPKPREYAMPIPVTKGEELEKTVRCLGCGHPVGVDSDGKIVPHQLPHTEGNKAEDCMGSGKQGKIKLAKNETGDFAGDMSMAEKKGWPKEAPVTVNTPGKHGPNDTWKPLREKVTVNTPGQHGPNDTWRPNRVPDRPAHKAELNKAWRAGGPQPKSGSMAVESTGPPNKMRGSVIAKESVGHPAAGGGGKSPKDIRGVPMHGENSVSTGKVWKSPANNPAKFAPQLKSELTKGPPPIPAGAQKMPAPRPMPIKPLKLPGMTPRIGAEPKMKLQPVVNTTPRAPTMGHVKVPTAKAEGAHQSFKYTDRHGLLDTKPKEAVKPAPGPKTAKFSAGMANGAPARPAPAAKSEPKAQTQVDKTLVSGANAQMGNFKSIASNPTKMPGGGKMAKAETCKSCGKSMHKGSCK